MLALASDGFLYGLIAFGCLLVLLACIAVDLLQCALGWPRWRK